MARASGPRAPNQGAKCEIRVLSRRLSFTTVWEAATLPRIWTTGVIQYFYKAGEPSSMGNYRGITLLDVVSKLFHKVLANRLVKYAEGRGLLHTAQNALLPAWPLHG
jgi:hypothetical protein